MPPRTRAVRARPTVDVTAVLVAHDGAAWLPTALAALAASTIQPARIVLVDTGSTDGSLEALQAFPGAELLVLPRETGFGAAVAAALGPRPGLAEPAATSWVWLLHDDCAPRPDTLAALLAQAGQSPSAALLGPKVLDWDDPRLLVEVGVTIDGGGHRETGLERREYDQGQHDGLRDVLAVGTAGALVRRSAYDEVGGLDPELALFRDDLDLGWKLNAAGHRVVVVPSAVVHHARAATTGRRSTDASPGSLAGTDRRHALYVLLAHSGRLRLLALLVRVLLGAVLRIVGLLLTRQLSGARDELVAVATVLGRPRRLAAARRLRRRSRTVPASDLRPLLASGTARVRARLGALGDWLSGGAAPGTSSALGDPGPEGPDELAEMTSGGTGALRRLLLKPPVLLLLALALVALVAERSVLALGGGSLVGGRLLPPGDGAADLWRAYAASWHPATVGSPGPAPPYLALLALVSTLLLGKVWLAVDLLLLASVPIAGVTAYLAAGRVVTHLVLRLWAAVTWALLPVATGGIATGRLDVAAVQIGLPLVAIGAARLLSPDPRKRGWRGAWGLGLGLAAVAAFSPLIWALGALVLLGGGGLALLRSGSPRRALAALIAVGVPVVVLLPWSAVRGPGRLLQGPGLLVDEPSLISRHFGQLDLVLLHPGGAGLPPVWVTAGLVLAALGGLVRRDRRRLAMAGWAVAALGLLSAVLLPHLQLAVDPGTDRLPVWPGGALQVAGAGLLVAALVAADGVRTRLVSRAFGWRQLTASVVAGACALLPVLAAATWLARGADTPLRRGTASPLPPFAAAEVGPETGLRVLLLEPATAGRVRYELMRSGDVRLGAADTAPRRGQLASLDAVVADLLTASGSDAAEALATRAVRYVALTNTPAAREFALVLDQQAGLTRRSAGPVLLWQVLAPTARLTLLPETLAEVASSGARAASRSLLHSVDPVVLPTRREGATATLPVGGPGRLLVLAEAQDPGWRATLDGRPLARRTAWGWAQGFVVPAGGGRLEVSRDQAGRRVAVALQLAAIVVVLVLAAPGAARRRGLEVVDDDDAGATGPASPSSLRGAPHTKEDL